MCKRLLTKHNWLICAGIRQQWTGVDHSNLKPIYPSYINLLPESRAQTVGRKSWGGGSGNRDDVYTFIWPWKCLGSYLRKGVAIWKVLIERFYCITKAPKLTIQKQTSSTETKLVTWNVQLLDHTSCKGIYAIRSCCICYLQSLYMLFSVTVYGKSRLATLARHCFLKKV